MFIIKMIRQKNYEHIQSAHNNFYNKRHHDFQLIKLKSYNLYIISFREPKENKNFIIFKKGTWFEVF